MATFCRYHALLPEYHQDPCMRCHVWCVPTPHNGYPVDCQRDLLRPRGWNARDFHKYELRPHEKCVVKYTFNVAVHITKSDQQQILIPLSWSPIQLYGGAIPVKHVRQEAFNAPPGYAVLNRNLLTTNLIWYPHLNVDFNVDPCTRSFDVISAFKAEDRWFINLWHDAWGWPRCLRLI